MKKRNSSPPTYLQDDNRSNGHSTEPTLQSSQLLKLFENELKGIFWVEKSITRTIPKLIKYATSQELIDELKSHHAETENHITRLEQVFDSLGRKTASKKCEVMDSLLKEAREITEVCEAGAMCDAGIIMAIQKIEHYEIASYGTLCVFAKTLGEDAAADLLQDTFEEEKDAAEILSEIAQSISLEVADEFEYDEDTDTMIETMSRLNF